MTKPSVVMILGRLLPYEDAAAEAAEEVFGLFEDGSVEEEGCSIIPISLSAFFLSIGIIFDSLTTFTEDNSVRHCGQVEADIFVHSRMQSVW